MTAEYLAEFNGSNVGVLLGKASEGLCSIDCDSEAALESFLESNPQLRESLISRGQRGGNVWVRVVGEYPRSAKVKGFGELAS
jgi:hypothetical protein